MPGKPPEIDGSVPYWLLCLMLAALGFALGWVGSQWLMFDPFDP